MRGITTPAETLHLWILELFSNLNAPTVKLLVLTLFLAPTVLAAVASPQSFVSTHHFASTPKILL